MWSKSEFLKNLASITWTGGPPKVVQSELKRQAEINGVDLEDKTCERLARSLKKWSSETAPSIDSICLLSAILGVSLDDLLSTPLAAVPESADIATPRSLVRPIIGELLNGGDTACHEVVRAALSERGIRGEFQDFLTRRITSIEKSSFANPTVSDILSLASAFGLSISRLLADRATRQPEIHERQPDPHWLFEFLPNYCNALHCYGVVAAKSDIDDWRNRSSLPNGQRFEDEEKRIAAAESWAKSVRVGAVTSSLAKDHKLAIREAVGTPVYELIEQRLSWIGECGPELALVMQTARRKAYLGVYDGLFGRAGLFSRSPTMKYLDGGQREERSLQVVFDRIPCREDQEGWLIYYFWGPRLMDDVRRNLIGSSGE